jgi:hypothetical protein
LEEVLDHLLESATCSAAQNSLGITRDFHAKSDEQPPMMTSVRWGIAEQANVKANADVPFEKHKFCKMQEM